MADYILIDAKTRAPVPLPFHTESGDGLSMTVNNFSGPTYFSPEGVVFCKLNGATVARHPQFFDLAIITEVEFMSERDQ